MATRLALRSDVLTVGTFRNLYVMHIHGRITMDELMASHRVHLELIARGESQTGVLTLASTVHNQKGWLVLEGEQKYLLKRRGAVP